MPITPRIIRTLAAVSTAVLAVLVLALHLSSTQASHDPGAMAAMSIDMDPGASPANTATSLGTREFCARIDQNGALDADEDAVDTVQFDVTAEGIPPETAMFAFSYTLEYGATALTVQSHDANFLLVSAPGSSPSDVSQSLPDTSGTWIASVVDLVSAAVESGSGVLDRVVVGANAGATAGVYGIELHSAAHGDRTNTYHSPEVTFPGFVAIDALCPSVPPTSAPTPTESPTPTPEPTPAPTPSPSPSPTPTPGPTPVPVISKVPPPYDPDLVLCLEQFESQTECDGDTHPGAVTDLRLRFCVGWNSDCTVRDSPVNDALYHSLTAFFPPSVTITEGSDLQIGALMGHLYATATLGILNGPCNNRIDLTFTLVNASVNTADIQPSNPLGDANHNRIPDGAEHYPSFVLDATDPDFASYGPDLIPHTADDVNGPLAPAQPVARLFALTAITPFLADVVQVIVFPPGATLRGPAGPITSSPELGYPVVFILNDPSGPATPGAFKVCAPFVADAVIFGQTRDNPCTPFGTGDANCFGQPLQLSRGIPLFPCETRNTVDEDGDGVINDGCPMVNNVAESGADCLDALSNDSEDSAVNDGCPQVGLLSEGAFIPDPDGCDTDADEASCTFIKNPLRPGPVDFVVYPPSLRDADGDQIDNTLDTCPYTPNPSWDPKNQGFLHAGDADFDGLPDECDPDAQTAGLASPIGCRGGYTGADEDQDCLSNTVDNCPLVNQLQDPTRPPSWSPAPGFPPQNLPAALDRDEDGIGDVCDRSPTTPDGGFANLCLRARLHIAGHEAKASVSVRTAGASECHPQVRLLPLACAPYDVTGDTTVNVRDITAVARAMGSRPGGHRWNPAADVNDDGRVNYRDLALVLRAVRSRDCRQGRRVP